jgi:hypothetical protein
LRLQNQQLLAQQQQQHHQQKHLQQQPESQSGGGRCEPAFFGEFADTSHHHGHHDSFPRLSASSGAAAPTSSSTFRPQSTGRQTPVAAAPPNGSGLPNSGRHHDEMEPSAGARRSRDLHPSLAQQHPQQRQSRPGVGGTFTAQPPPPCASPNNRNVVLSMLSGNVGSTSRGPSVSPGGFCLATPAMTLRNGHDGGGNASDGAHRLRSLLLDPNAPLPPARGSR